MNKYIVQGMENSIFHHGWISFRVEVDADSIEEVRKIIYKRYRNCVIDDIVQID